jgi:ABC-type uncharacterized transport system involved in gliding motility auxiliary subunit
MALKRLAPLGLALGIGGFIAAAVIWILQRQFDVYVQGSLVVGMVGLALAMMLNPGVVQTWLGGRQARYGSNVLIMTVFFIGILVLINYIVYKNPKRWDLTEDQTNTLSAETIDALKQLAQPVVAVGFYSAQNSSAQSTAQKLLDRYKIESAGKFNYEFHDPLSEPTVAKQYNITRDSTLILTMGEQREELTFASEQEITGALIRFAHPTKRTVYFVTGHGEKDSADSGEQGLSKIADLLKRQNYEVQTVNLQVTTTVPSDAKVLIIAGSKIPVTETEVSIIRQYLDNGGKLVVLLDPPVQTQMKPGTPEPLVSYLETAWGLKLAQDVIVDLYNSVSQQPLIPVTNSYSGGPITDKLQNIATGFPLVRTVVVSGTTETFPNINYTQLVKTQDDRAWGETDLESLSASNAPAAGDGDTKPPFFIGVAAQNATTKARIVVFGDSDFASNTWADQGANSQLFANSLNWAAADENLLTLSTKSPTTRTLALMDALTINLILLVTVILMPLSVLILGGVVWFQRRRHV